MIVRSRPLRPRGPLAALLVACLALGGTAATRAETPHESWRLCARQVGAAEAAHRMPRLLLSAISQVEAGRWKADTRENLAWPWTVTAEGKGRFLPSKAAAIAEVRRLRARGVRNIDVGCMQINLMHHPDAFDDLEAAFDPVRNVAYAVRFLAELRETWGSWTRAVGNYHSNTPTLSGAYRAKVFRALYAEKHRRAKARRAARLAAAGED